MKKTILVCGIISGLIVSLVLSFSTVLSPSGEYFENGMLLGFGSMILAFSLIFVGIKNYRDKQAGGMISFGKAFQIGALIALIGSTLYVLTWLVIYYNFLPDFWEKYAASEMKHLAASGATQEELTKHEADMIRYGEMYKNPVFTALFTHMEILPLGLVISLIAALIMKRKSNTVAV
jgi:hypothetical protein